MSRSALKLAIVALVAFGARPAIADTIQFDSGSLIIPMEATFQPAGGMVSAYGLVYRILQANAAGHLNANNPVTVYIVNNPGKSSPNRCIPTNLSSVNTSGTSTNTRSGLGTWTDGCDFSITNATRQPVVPVDYSIAYPAAGYSDAAIPTYTDSDAFPQYNHSATLTTANNFRTVSYLGASFVIQKSDAAAVINLLRNGDTGTNAVPKTAIDIFTDGQKSPSSHCDASGISTNTGNDGNGITIATGCHYVVMHQSTAQFTANVDRRINNAPRAFLLFEPGNPGSGGAILDKYLKVAGLMVSGTSNGADSRGCPVGNVTGCSYNGSTCTSGTECPATNGAVHGNIYDLVSDTDNRYQSATNYPNGLINYKVGGKLYYRLYWAPHWDGSSGDVAAVQNVTTFLNNPSTAMMSECASITLWENGDGSSKSSTSNTYGGPSHNSNFLFTAGINVSSTVSGPNCTDPKVPSTSSCASYPNPGNIFSQVGDWMYQSEGGSNPGYKALSARQSWTKQMVTTSNGYDAFDMGQKDASHGVVIYVSGHDVSGDPSGARVVLNSMLNLSGDPISSERDLAAPVVASGRSDSATNYNDTLMTATYQAVTGYSTNPAVQTLDPNNLALWTFPYYPGDLRAHDLASLTAGETTYDTATSWDAASILSNPSGLGPTPSQRNIFTFLGGYPKANPSMAGGGAAPNGVLQWGWVPEAIDGNILSSVCTLLGTVTTGCVDVLGYQKLVTSTVYDDGETTSNARLVVGPNNADGLCDLQEMVNYSNINTGADWTGGDCNAHNIRTFLTDAPNVAFMLQRVRGYCYAGSVTALLPGDASCSLSTVSNVTNSNRGQLGGLAHSTPAVVGPSPNISDTGAKRPTVAYVGGLDGELHAFYVGGGSGYTGPTSTLHFPYSTNVATTKFKKDWLSGGFTPPAVGTELWAYLPATQLPHLYNNSARVDSSPVVMDVFADFQGSGLREWHTVLVQSIGELGNELFAMDITNPLKPRLLWDIAGTVQTGTNIDYSPNMLLNDSFSAASGGTASCTFSGNSPLPGSCISPKWTEGTAKYVSLPSSDTGRKDTKVYDYQDLGGASALSLAQIRIGLEPYYVLYVATNMKSGSSGIEVFAIDVATGQKLWQWEHAYATSPSIASNSVPPAPSIIYGQNGASQILVGDMEGKVWDLDALTGANVKDVASCQYTSACNLPLFNAVSTAANMQPISTNIAVAKVPSTATGTLSSCKGATVLVFGTAGRDWAAAAGNAGKVHVVVFDNGGNASCSLGEPANFPVVFPAGERVYGNITVAGGVAYVSTATGSVGNDLMSVSGTTSGKTYALDLGASSGNTLSTQVTQLSGSLATFGGLAVYAPAGDGSAPSAVIGAEVSKINVIKGSPITSLPNSKVDKSLNPSKTTLSYQLRNWLQRLLK